VIASPAHGAAAAYHLCCQSDRRRQVPHLQQETKEQLRMGKHQSGVTRVTHGCDKSAFDPSSWALTGSPTSHSLPPEFLAHYLHLCTPGCLCIFYLHIVPLDPPPTHTQHCQKMLGAPVPITCTLFSVKRDCKLSWETHQCCRFR
jgi:hypothetical protein